MDASVFTTLLCRDVVCTPVIQDWKAWPRPVGEEDKKYGEWIDKLPFIYIRFHGAKQLYASNYGEEELKNGQRRLISGRKNTMFMPTSITMPEDMRQRMPCGLKNF